MYLTDLALKDFRSHRDVLVNLQPGVTALTGANGQGKTNLVEAIAYLATLSSHRASNSSYLVRDQAGSAQIRAKLVRGERALVISLELVPGKASRAKLGKNSVRPANLLGLTKVVCFVPEDLALVKGGPEVRRRYLDQLLVQMRPALAGVMTDYERVVQQRTSLLKSIGAASGTARQEAISTLETWDERAATFGGGLTANRMALVDDLAPLISSAYQAIAPAGQVVAAYHGVLDLVGRPEAAVVTAGLLQAMTQNRQKEIDRGVSLFGPHREDLALSLDSLPARGYASHGESWSLALALRLGSFQLMRQDAKDDPILILDDVFAELDNARRYRLTGLIGDVEQVIITAAVPSDVPTGLVDRWYQVSTEGVEPQDGPDGRTGKTGPEPATGAADE
ncbi:MAG: DNA replication/repair protein RecF [Bifidobacteriaceae bacterium]|jgi:DNA replication and repair protein RecF|nr:DNA replication/repair protein RecF [Bifidobacteriaceae bacterium]